MVPKGNTNVIRLHLVLIKAYKITATLPLVVTQCSGNAVVNFRLF